MLNYTKLAVAVPHMEIANCPHNTENILTEINNLYSLGANVILFPELCITGYTCNDLFFQTHLLKSAENCMISLLDSTKNIDAIISVGVPISTDNQIFNCMAMLHKGKLLGLVTKTYLPNYNEFYEERWFASTNDLITSDVYYANQTVPIGADLLFCDVQNPLLKIGVEICEDLWACIPPSSYLAQNGATIILNGSASNELVAKPDYRKNLISQQSSRCICAYAYSSAGIGESTQDTVFSGHSMIFENGICFSEIQPFSKDVNTIISDIDLELLTNERKKQTTFMPQQHKDFLKNNPYRRIYFTLDSNKHKENNTEFYRYVNPKPFTPEQNDLLSERCQHIFNIQTVALARRFQHTHSDKLVIGISGGLDSTLALLVAVKSCDYLNIPRTHVLGITMPGFGTTDRTYQNALNLMKALGISTKEISIAKSVRQHFEDIEHDENIHNITYENSQARERTKILMNIANQQNGIVVGTGDLSELALGWATYNGDHMSMYGVNGGVPKTLVKVLVNWVATSNELEDAPSKILLDVIDTPVSPELLPPDDSGNIQQKTEDVVGPYELHDFFLYQILRHGFPPKKVLFLAENAFKDTYDHETILRWLKNFYRRFFMQQFKRSCLPDGVKIGSICLSPRGDWRMPTDAFSDIWLAELENL